MEMQCIDKEGNEIIIGDTNGDSIAKRQSWREDDCSTCATDSDFNLDELFLMNPGTHFIFYSRGENSGTGRQNGIVVRGEKFY